MTADKFGFFPRAIPAGRSGDTCRISVLLLPVMAYEGIDSLACWPMGAATAAGTISLWAAPVTISDNGRPELGDASKIAFAQTVAPNSPPTPEMLAELLEKALGLAGLDASFKAILAEATSVSPPDENYVATENGQKFPRILPLKRAEISYASMRRRVGDLYRAAGTVNFENPPEFSTSFAANKQLENLRADEASEQDTLVLEALERVARATEARSAYHSGKDRDKALVALDRHLQELTDPLHSWLLFHQCAIRPDAPGTEAPDDLPKTATKVDEGAKSIQDWPKHSSEEAESEKKFHARSLLAALRASPVLQHLFGFAVDCTIDINDINAIHDQVALNGFVAIAASRNGDPPPPVAGESPFVLARLTETGFWPATREELEVGATESPPPAAKAAISQRNGVVDLGASFQPAEGPIRRRFALTTLDPGLEAERMWRARNATPGSGAETARSTRGFVLIDSWRNAAVSAAHAWNTGKGANPDFLDADDLTVGYRLDVALRRGDGTTEWRSLHQREISYFHPDDSRDGRHPEPGKDRLKPWLERIGLGYESDRRRDLDEGWLVPAVRRRREAGNVEYLHAEEVLATWAGEPLGMSCGGEPVTLKPGSELQIPRRYRLPDEDSEDAFKIPPLRFGWSYRFGLRPVWQGGVSVSIREAGAAYATEVAGRDMAFPPALDSRARYRRFLRHEPVLKPVVLLSEREIADEQKPGSPMLARQSANVAVLRSVQGKPTDKRAHPDTTTRYILPPECTYETALRHGLFDDETRAKDGTAYADSTPAGAFLDLAFDESWGGFPLHSVPEKRELPRTLLRTGAANGKLPPQEKAEPVFRAEPGRAAEKARSRAEKLRQRRPGPYFADPAARKLVIALRPSAAASGTGYFPGTPIVVDFGDEGVPLPVELRIEKAKEHPRFGQITEQKDFWSSSKPALSRAAGIKVQSVTLRLPPGASVAVDLWYAPADAQLRQLFDLPESIAIVSGTTHGTALADLVPLPDGVSPGQWPKSGESWAGEGECTVSAAAVGKAAARLSARLARLPVPAISGVETLMATHAIDRPMAPAWPKEPKLATRRVPAEDKDNAIRIEALKRLAGEAATKSDASDRPGQTGFVLGGIAEFDRDTASRLLIEADAPGLMGQAMDDPARGRSPADRLGDEWHANWPVTRETLKYVENAPADSTGKRGIDTVLRSTDPDARRAFTRAWFGFEVAANGEVTLPLARAQVVGIDAIGVLDGSHPPSNGVRETIHLAGEQLNALTGAGHRNRVLALEAFQDHRARKLRLRLTAISRHAPHFRWLAPRKDQKLGWLPAEDEYQPADQTSLIAEAASTAEVWVKASRRPDPPAAREVSLVFEVREIPSTTVDTAKGKTPIREGCREWRGVARLRIELDRPWFSSGEGERLGIVLWPPRGLAGLDERLAAGKVPRDPFRPDMANLINLADFDDADLGDGGAFVSRLGADPIRDMPTSFQPGEPGWDGVPVPAIGPFLAEAMFRDFVAPDGATDRFWAERVDNVAMPVAVVAPDKDSTQPPATPETLLVSLVTYEPRFDIRREKWFVDVALDAGPYPDPFLRLGLVRYQKEALPGLECSSPVVRWTQVPPSRQIRVEWKERRAPKAAPLVDLSVSIYPAERRRVGGDGEAVPEPYIKSRFRVAIHLRQQTRAGRMEEIVAIGPDGTLLEFECQPYTLPAMTRTLCLSPLEAGKGEYLLVVDEVQAFESTVDRPAEPISGESKTPRDNPSVDSGPRFQFREVLDLPTRPVLPARRKAEPKAEPAIRRRRPTSPEAGEVAIPGNRPEGHGD